MTTQTATTTPQSFKTLGAQRRRAQADRDSAEAELRAIAAQQAAGLAEAEAEGARRQAEQQQAQVRLAQHRAALDDLDAFLKQQRERERQEWSREYDKRQETLRQFRALANEKPTPVPLSLDEARAFLAQLDAEQQAREEREERDRIDFEWRKRQAGTLAAFRDLARQQQQERDAEPS